MPVIIIITIIEQNLKKLTNLIRRKTITPPQYNYNNKKYNNNSYINSNERIFI